MHLVAISSQPKDAASDKCISKRVLRNLPRHWVEYFSQPEFQVILSGSMVSISVREMQMHTRYSGGYNSLSKQIVWLWRTLGAMGPKDLAKFLKFVTSCERPPLLGFSDCVHHLLFNSPRR